MISGAHIRCKALDEEVGLFIRAAAGGASALIGSDAPNPARQHGRRSRFVLTNASDILLSGTLETAASRPRLCRLHFLPRTKRENLIGIGGRWALSIGDPREILAQSTLHHPSTTPGRTSQGEDGYRAGKSVTSEVEDQGGPRAAMVSSRKPVQHP